jgi:hypothetical protein
MANDIFTNHMNILLDKGSKFIENYMVIGDLNYDILTPDKSQVLDDLCDIFEKQRLFLLVSITSTNDGSYPFIKHVGFSTIFVKSKISHKSSSTYDLSGVKIS